MATVSGNTISGTGEKDIIYSTDYISDSSTYVEIFGLDGDDNLSDFIAESRLTFIYGGNGDDVMSGSAYSKASFASYFIYGGYGADIFLIPGRSNGVPLLTRKTGATEIKYADINGAKFTAHVGDSTEVIVWIDSNNNIQMFLTEDISKGRQRAADAIELKFRVNERPDWSLNPGRDTYIEYQNYLASKSSNTKTKYDTRDFTVSILGSTSTSPAPLRTQIIDGTSSTSCVINVVASTWSDNVKVTRVVKASDAGEKLEGKQIDF